MDDALICEKNQHGHYLRWRCDSGEPGLELGTTECASEDKNTRVAAHAISAAIRDGEFGGSVAVYARVWIFPSSAAARKALRIAKTAIRAARDAAEVGKAWPAWAIKARVEGWRAPRGWRP